MNTLQKITTLITFTAPPGGSGNWWSRSPYVYKYRYKIWSIFL